MIKFLRHRKFWLPIMTLMLLLMFFELFLRLGYWDRHLEKNSFLGKTIERKKALDSIDLSKVNWITIGDSRVDWGINHNRLYLAQEAMDKTHLRLSFEGAHFMTMQVLIDWSIKNMPNLEGVLIGATASNLSQYTSMTSNQKLIWPFRSFLNSDQYQYYRKKSEYKLLKNASAISVYWSDVKNFLFEPIKRYKKSAIKTPFDANKIFKYNSDIPQNFCEFKVDTLKNCIETAERLKNDNQFYLQKNYIINHCGTQSAKKRLQKNIKKRAISQVDIENVSQNLRNLFKSIISKNKKLYLFEMPENKMYTHVINNSNSEEVLKQIKNEFMHATGFHYIDLSHVFEQERNLEECEFYLGPTHYNNNGKRIITDRIIEYLKLNQ